MEHHVSELLNEIGNLEKCVTNTEEPMPYIIEEMKQLKDRYEREEERKTWKELIRHLPNQIRRGKANKKL